MVDAPLRVLHVIDTLEVGGAQRHVLSLAEALRSRGHRCTIATSGEARPAGAEEIQVVPLAGASISHRLPLRFTARLIRLLAEYRVDIVHAHLHASSLAAAVAAGAHRLPLVITHHSDGAWQQPFQRKLDRWASARAHTAIAVARTLAPELATGNLPPVLIPNGVLLPARQPGERERLRAELGIPPRAFVAGFTGRFVEDKDPLLFVEMAMRITARHDATHFLMVGDGVLSTAVRQRIAQDGLARHFTLTGIRPDASRIHAAADVVVVPSRREACPLVPLEAMAAGCPVVGTAVGDMPDQIADGVTGYVVPPGDVDSLVAAVLALADPSLGQRFGRAALERVAERYSLERMVEQTLAVYVDVLRAEEPSLTGRTESRAAGRVAGHAR